MIESEMKRAGGSVDDSEIWVKRKLKWLTTNSYENRRRKRKKEKEEYFKSTLFHVEEIALR